MSLSAVDWLGVADTAGQQGLLFGLVALSVAITYRVLDFPDLTVDGSFALGGAVVAALLERGLSPIPSTLLAVLAGACAGSVTGMLHARLRISRILSGILVMTMLYSINLRVMGRPNLSLLGKSTLLTPIEKGHWPGHLGETVFFGLVVVIALAFLVDMFRRNFGLLLLATGNNPRATLAAGQDPGRYRVVGLALGNALCALSGALCAQSFGFADIGMGVGMLVIGFASMLIGEAIFGRRTAVMLLLAAVAGSVIYQGVVATGLQLGLAPTDLKLATGVIVIVALAAQNLRRGGVSATEVEP